eukprot:1157093-Pelagomonas_calceolata.AAC.7
MRLLSCNLRKRMPTHPSMSKDRENSPQEFLARGVEPLTADTQESSRHTQCVWHTSANTGRHKQKASPAGTHSACGTHPPTYGRHKHTASPAGTHSVCGTHPPTKEGTSTLSHQVTHCILWCTSQATNVGIVSHQQAHTVRVAHIHQHRKARAHCLTRLRIASFGAQARPPT